MGGDFMLRKKFVFLCLTALLFACSLSACRGGTAKEVEKVKPEVGSFVLTQEKMPVCTCGYGHDDPRECPDLAADGTVTE